jgi:hypothetical protein
VVEGGRAERFGGGGLVKGARGTWAAAGTANNAAATDMQQQQEERNGAAGCRDSKQRQQRQPAAAAKTASSCSKEASNRRQQQQQQRLVAANPAVTLQQPAARAGTAGSRQRSYAAVATISWDHSGTRPASNPVSSRRRKQLQSTTDEHKQAVVTAVASN